MTKKNTLFLAVNVLAILTLSACGTINGMGQDLQAAGRGVQDAVN